MINCIWQSFRLGLVNINGTASSEFGTYSLCEQRRFRQACASAQSRQNIRCSLIQAVSQEEPSDRKPDPWPLWMAGHAQLKFVMTECSKTQIRLTELNAYAKFYQSIPYGWRVMANFRELMTDRHTTSQTDYRQKGDYRAHSQVRPSLSANFLWVVQLLNNKIFMKDFVSLFNLTMKHHLKHSGKIFIPCIQNNGLWQKV